VLRKNADRRARGEYQQRLKRYREIAAKVRATVDPTLVCLTPDGIFAGKVEAPEANEVVSFFRCAEKMSATATAAASKLAERAERARKAETPLANQPPR